MLDLFRRGEILSEGRTNEEETKLVHQEEVKRIRTAPASPVAGNQPPGPMAKAGRRGFTAEAQRRGRGKRRADKVKNFIRQVIHGTRSAKGLENHSVLRSLFETVRRQGQQPHAFFFTLFTQDTAQAQAALYRRPPLSPSLRC